MTNHDQADVWAKADAMIEQLAAAHEAHERRKAERRNTPEARAIRADAARRGWDAKRAREAEERAEQERRDWRPPVPDGPLCDEMNHNSIGSEVFCARPPDHDGDCESACGTTWQRDE